MGWSPLSRCFRGFSGINFCLGTFMDRLVTVAGHGVRGERDDRDGAGIRARLQGAGGGPAVEDRKVHVEEDHIRLSGPRLTHARLPIMGQDHFIASTLQASGQEVPNLLMILDK